MGVYMDIEISNMFSEKNQEIFTNKLRLDLERNSEAFKTTTQDKAKLSVAELFASLKMIYSKYKIDIDSNNLKELLSTLKRSLLEDLEDLIDDKQQNNFKYITDNNTQTINKTYLRNYHCHIDDSEDTFEENLPLVIHEPATKFYNDLLNIYLCKDEEMQNAVYCLINNDFPNKLIKRIIDESKLRNTTLKNMSEETYEYYQNLNSSNKPNKGKNKSLKKTD